MRARTPRTRPPPTRLAVALVAALAGTVHAEGNLARRAERLETLEIDGAAGFSVGEYRLETGRFYRWRIAGDGRDEYRVLAPELFENAWIEQVVIDDLEVQPHGLRAVEFDAEGEIDVFFVPIRPGTYPFYVEHLRGDGFEGRFVVE